MKNQKTQSKLIVAMSAVILLLVALSATLTFAYFTASTSNNAQNMQFGTLKIDGTGLSVNEVRTGSIENLVPGDKISLGGKAYLTSNIDYFVRANLEVAVYDEGYVPNTLNTEADDYATQLATMKTAHDISHKNPANFNGGAVIKGNLGDDVAAANEATSYRGIIMALLFSSASENVDQIYSYFLADGDWITPLENADGWKYYNKRVAASDSELRIFDITSGEKTFAIADYQNAWQGVKVEITLKIQAVQAQNINGANEIENGDNGKLDATKVGTLHGLTDVWAAVESGKNVTYTHA